MAKAAPKLVARAESMHMAGTLAMLVLIVLGIFVLLDVDLHSFIGYWDDPRPHSVHVELPPLPDAGAGAGIGIGIGSARVLKPAGVALHPFVLFSAYRFDESTLYVIGLVSRLVRDQGRPAFQCEWHSGLDASRRVVTKPVLHEGDTDWGKLPYTEVVMACNFSRPVGMDGLGGSLHVVVKADPQVGEVMTLRVPGKQVLVATVEALRESPGYNFTAATAGPYPYKYAFCSAPISGSIRPQALRQWLVYHLYMYQGHRAHFFLYNVGGLNEQAQDILKPFLEAGVVTVWDILEQPLYPTWWTSQILFMDDCVHRSRYLADWVVFHDFDEFLYVAPPNTLQGLMETHSEAPLVTFGSWEIDVESCRPDGNGTDMWPLERMVWRLPNPECRDRKQQPSLCIGSVARRKYVLNPRKEITVAVHITLGHSYRTAVHLNTSVARIEHYRGIFSLGKRPCSHVRNQGIPVPPEPKRFSMSTKEMECALCALIPQAQAEVSSMFNSTPQGKAFVHQLLLDTRTLQ